jgi:hypothetical protein
VNWRIDMAYTITYPEGIITRDSDGFVIPQDDQDHDWAEYLVWLAAGGELTIKVAE